MYGAEGPSVGHLVCLTDQGDRVWANIEDAAVLADMVERENCGLRVEVSLEGVASFC
jgi:hypothetical protein